MLQAADVLLYNATHVPVGEDQKQHLELARDIAQKFNNDFCSEDAPLFTLPDPIIPPEAARIMSLRDGSAKMSKSDPSDMSRINLTDDADAIMQKVKKAKTDPEPLPGTVEGLAGRPEANNLVGIYAAMAGTSPAEVLAQFEGQGFGKFKPALGELLVETLAPISARFRDLLEDREALDAILARGAARARETGVPTLYLALGVVAAQQPYHGSPAPNQIAVWKGNLGEPRASRAWVYKSLLGSGARVVFGPANRPLPQLPITVDDEGYLVAQSDFTEPVGPSYWERDSG